MTALLFRSCSSVLIAPQSILDFWGALLLCFTLAPLRGKRNGSAIMIVCRRNAVSGFKIQLEHQELPEK